MSWKEFVSNVIEVLAITACLVIVVILTWRCQPVERMRGELYGSRYWNPERSSVIASQQTLQNEFNSYENPPVFFADALHYGPDIDGAHIQIPRKPTRKPPVGPVCVERVPWRALRYLFWRRHGMECCCL